MDETTPAAPPEAANGVLDGWLRARNSGRSWGCQLPR